MRILVTGANGFIGKNLILRLSENTNIEVVSHTRDNPESELLNIISGVNAVIHLAGINRPDHESEFETGNTNLTQSLCDALEKNNHPVHILFASSIQAELDNPYGKSKKAAEQILKEFSGKTGSAVSIFRLPNVFGKWCRPEYNSVVATFCHNIVSDKNIDIHNPSSILNLVYIDDVITAFINRLHTVAHDLSYMEVSPIYEVTVLKLAEIISSFRKGRKTLKVDDVGNGLSRALYATYLSFLAPQDFAYPLQPKKDVRGSFVEILKTSTSGQFSYFTAGPGVTRGGHYHHTKNEKFLVVQGDALFRFKHLISNNRHEIRTSGENPEIVETIPGWVHDITNTGESELIVFLWANEIFDPNKPDTIKADINE